MIDVGTHHDRFLGWCVAGLQSPDNVAPAPFYLADFDVGLQFQILDGETHLRLAGIQFRLQRGHVFAGRLQPAIRHFVGDTEDRNTRASHRAKAVRAELDRPPLPGESGRGSGRVTCFDKA